MALSAMKKAMNIMGILRMVKNQGSVALSFLKVIDTLACGKMV